MIFVLLNASNHTNKRVQCSPSLHIVIPCMCCWVYTVYLSLILALLYIINVLLFLYHKYILTFLGVFVRFDPTFYTTTETRGNVTVWSHVEGRVREPFTVALIPGKGNRCNYLIALKCKTLGALLSYTLDPRIPSKYIENSKEMAQSQRRLE